MKKIPFVAKFIAAGAVLGGVHSYLVLQSMRMDEKMASHLANWYRDIGSFAQVGIFFVGPVFALMSAVWCHFKAGTWKKPPWLTAKRLILAAVVLFALNLLISSVNETTEDPVFSSLRKHTAQAFLNPVVLIPYLVVLAIGLRWSLNAESEAVSEMERFAVLGMTLGGLGGLILIVLLS